MQSFGNLESGVRSGALVRSSKPRRKVVQKWSKIFAQLTLAGQVEIPSFSDAEENPLVQQPFVRQAPLDRASGASVNRVRGCSRRTNHTARRKEVARRRATLKSFG